MATSATDGSGGPHGTAVIYYKDHIPVAMRLESNLASQIKSASEFFRISTDPKNLCLHVLMEGEKVWMTDHFFQHDLIKDSVEYFGDKRLKMWLVEQLPASSSTTTAPRAPQIGTSSDLETGHTSTTTFLGSSESDPTSSEPIQFSKETAVPNPPAETAGGSPAPAPSAQTKKKQATEGKVFMRPHKVLKGGPTAKTTSPITNATLKRLARGQPILTMPMAPARPSSPVKGRGRPTKAKATNTRARAALTADIPNQAGTAAPVLNILPPRQSVPPEKAQDDMDLYSEDEQVPDVQPAKSVSQSRSKSTVRPTVAKKAKGKKKEVTPVSPAQSDSSSEGEDSASQYNPGEEAQEDESSDDAQTVVTSSSEAASEVPKSVKAAGPAKSAVAAPIAVEKTPPASSNLPIPVPNTPASDSSPKTSSAVPVAYSGWSNTAAEIPSEVDMRPKPPIAEMYKFLTENLEPAPPTSAVSQRQLFQNFNAEMRPVWYTELGRHLVTYTTHLFPTCATKHDPTYDYIIAGLQWRSVKR